MTITKRGPGGPKGTIVEKLCLQCDKPILYTATMHPIDYRRRKVHGGCRSEWMKTHWKNRTNSKAMKDPSLAEIHQRALEVRASRMNCLKLISWIGIVSFVVGSWVAIGKFVLWVV